MVVRYLREWHNFPDAATTRELLGSDGTRQPGDVSFAPGICLSVKYTLNAPSWPAWLREVVAEAGPDRVPVVVQRIKGNRNVGEWPCVVPWLAWCDITDSGPTPDPFEMVVMGQHADYVPLLDRYPSEPFICHSRKDGSRAVMRFRTFVDAVRLDR
jgi:hypothetical protein